MRNLFICLIVGLSIAVTAKAELAVPCSKVQLQEATYSVKASKKQGALISFNALGKQKIIAEQRGSAYSVLIRRSTKELKEFFKTYNKVTVVERSAGCSLAWYADGLDGTLDYEFTYIVAAYADGSLGLGGDARDELYETAVLKIQVPR